MPKYLYKFSYSPEGLKGLMKDGGTGRRDASRQAAESLGGTLESYYFAWGEADGYAVVDMPDQASAAALALTVSSSGKVAVSTTVLITPEDMDAAAQRSVDYRAPGA